MAAAYKHRPPYPTEVFDTLQELIVDEPRAVLDIGAGEGAIARPLATRVDRIDAVDVSAAMIAAGRQRPGGQAANIRWIHSDVESATLDGPYALVTAGASLHWMRWPDTMNRLVPLLSPNAKLAIVDHGPRDLPWQDELLAIIKRHSRNPDYDPSFSIVDFLVGQGLLDDIDKAEFGPTPFWQPVADYVEQFHSTATLAREHMSPREVREFDEAVEAAVSPWITDGRVKLPIVAKVVWGRPQAG
ncbi:Methyltransferase type 12 [Stackebrandtia nassauensis DSM 44728]|uniref:Methyltransferase type 12 n=1 Tax=Stackebrandtia nassauensis (strain DSM 44728 / CIP 108903 / NRRL B-16338 / NBRC 102104 / LLR-40K-21) TaxID=446470 RepID=D3Q349_STANL|nr:Methyltransferase type 12 [Stackebrandtia nassauensis DSM 44728]